MTSQISPGDKARVKATGEIFTVEDVNPDWSSSPDCDEVFAEGSNAYGLVTIDSPDEVEVVNWCEPSAAQIAIETAHALFHSSGDLEVQEIDQQGEGLVAVLGRWNGVQGGFFVRFGPWMEDML